MKGLKFQRLVLLSDSKKLANQFEFQKRFNLVTGSDNSIGKSTLVKCLFWAIGCNPEFDEEWKSNDVKAVLYFNVNSCDYVVCRYLETISFGRIGAPLKKYSKISGAFSEKFSEITGFDLLLANRGGGLDCPPPAFYFLPFYIDQKRSWNTPWNGFDKLTQYKDFRRNLVKYFCGYLSSEHFEIEEEIFEKKVLEVAANQQVDRIDVAVEIFEEVMPKTPVAVTPLEFSAIQIEIESELKEFSLQQSKLYEQQSTLANEIYDLEKQHLIASESARELDEDYTFAVENVPSDSLECPLCGTEHDNSLISRAGLLADSEALEQQSSNLKILLDEKYQQRDELAEEYHFVSAEVNRINNKYFLEEDGIESEDEEVFEQALHAVTKKKVSQGVAKARDSYQIKSKTAQDQQKALKSDQRKLLSKNDRDELNERFMGDLIENIRLLSATGLNLNGVKSPMDYKKILGGGAAEGTRGTLAYQLSILRQIEASAHCELAPFVIDTPNQQEQAEHRYKKVLDVIMSNISNGFQVILCAMDNEALSPYKESAHVIELDGERLLKREHYEEANLEYERLLSTHD